MVYAQRDDSSGTPEGAPRPGQPGDGAPSSFVFLLLCFAGTVVSFILFATAAALSLAAASMFPGLLGLAGAIGVTVLALPIWRDLRAARKARRTTPRCPRA